MYYLIKKIFFNFLRLRNAWFRSRMKPCALKEVKGTGFIDIDALCASDLSREQVFSSKMFKKCKVKGKYQLSFSLQWNKQLFPARTHMISTWPYRSFLKYTKSGKYFKCATKRSSVMPVIILPLITKRSTLSSLYLLPIQLIFKK